MTDYIGTDDDRFDTKKEYDRVIKNKGSHGYSKQEAGGMLNVTPKMVINYEKEFVIWKEDEKTKRIYKYDTRTGKEYLSKEKYTAPWTGGTGYVKTMHPALQYHYEKNNIPLPGERSYNLNDIRYLEARIRYEQALSYKNKGDVKSRGLKLNTYNQKIAADKKAGRVLEDGRTIYEADYATKLNAIETEMTNLYAESSYKDKDQNLLNIRVQDKSKVQAKENELKKKAEAPPVKRNERYIEMQKRQKELDETVNKNPMKSNALKIPTKEVKTYDLRNLLQIEQ